MNYRTNLDYEEQLFNVNYQAGHKMNLLAREEFSFLLWFTQMGTLASDRQYSSEYKDFLKRQFLIETPQVPENEFQKNWWGKLENIELEKKLNSKLTSFEIEQSLNISPIRSVLVNSMKDLESVDFREEMVAKRPFSTSGRGLKRIRSLSDVHGLDFPFLLSPLHKRVLDFGTLVRGNSLETYYNFVDDHFQYKASLFGIDTPQIVKATLSDVIAAYRNLGAVDDFVIDSYIDEEETIRYLCEVNYRRTMGMIGQMIKEKYFSNYKYLLSVLVNLNSRRDDIPGVYWLSPKEGQKRFHLAVIPLNQLKLDQGLFPILPKPLLHFFHTK